MAKLEEHMKLKISLEMAQDAEEFIRNLVRQEIAKVLEEERQKRGWQPVKPWPPIQQKGASRG